MPANLENSAVATGLERSVFIPVPEKGNAKECSNYHIIALISHASKVMLQVRVQQYVNQELADVQIWFRKSRGTRDQIANIHWLIGKAREFQKNIYFCFIVSAKAFDYVDHNCGKFFKRRKYQTTLPASWENCMLFNLYTEYIMQDARLDEAQARIKVARRNINNLRKADDTKLIT